MSRVHVSGEEGRAGDPSGVTVPKELTEGITTVEVKASAGEGLTASLHHWVPVPWCNEMNAIAKHPLEYPLPAEGTTGTSFFRHTD